MACADFLNGLSTVFAFIAAGLWLWSTLVKIPNKYETRTTINFLAGKVPIGHDPTLARASSDIQEFGHRLAKENRLSACAAVFSGAAAFVQAIVPFSQSPKVRRHAPNRPEPRSPARPPEARWSEFRAQLAILVCTDSDGGWGKAAGAYYPNVHPGSF